MTPREAMELAVTLAMDAENLFSALETAQRAYAVCGYTDLIDTLLQQIIRKAAERNKLSALTQAAEVYHRMLLTECIPA